MGAIFFSFYTFKKNSIHKNYKQLTFDDGFRLDVDFDNTVEEWKPYRNDEEEIESTELESTELLMVSFV